MKKTAVPTPEKINFTDLMIKALKPKSKSYILREWAARGEGGFCIRVMPSGAKTWQMIYTFEGQRKWFSLGEYPALSLSNARTKFQTMRRLLAEGMDPGETTRQAGQERRDSWTVGKLCDEFLEKYASVHKRPRSAEQDELNLARDVRKPWGKKKSRDIRRGDVIDILDAIVKRGSPTQAKRTLATIRKMFAWAVEREVLEVNPAAGISKPGGKEKPRDRVLELEEIVIMWKALDSRDDIPNWLARALKMILLTGARPGEILNLRWEQLKDGWFELSGDETKNDHPTRIYLSSLAKLIMGSPGEGPLFVKDDGKLPEVYDLSAWLRRRDRLGLAHWSAHDLRRTCTTGLAELGTLPHVVDRILNHVLKGVTERHYNKYLYAAEIAAALDAWGRKISTALAEKDVEQPGLAKVIRLFK